MVSVYKLFLPASPGPVADACGRPPRAPVLVTVTAAARDHLDLLPTGLPAARTCCLAVEDARLPEEEACCTGRSGPAWAFPEWPHDAATGRADSATARHSTGGFTDAPGASETSARNPWLLSAFGRGLAYVFYLVARVAAGPFTPALAKTTGAVPGGLARTAATTTTPPGLRGLGRVTSTSPFPRAS